MAKLNDLIVTIGANTRRFDKGLGNSMRKMKQFGKNTKALGRNLTRSLTMPLAALGGLAVKTAADFEFSMAKVAVFRSRAQSVLHLCSEEIHFVG